MNYPQYILDFTLDTIFPIKCIGCGEFSRSRKEYLCKQCLKRIPIKKIFECIGCKTSVPLGKTCFRCKKDNHIDQLLVAYDYNHPTVIKTVKTLKYRFVIDLKPALSTLIKKYLFWLSSQKNFSILENNPIITPLPLHYRRLNWRGFNQAELLADCVADSIQFHAKNGLIKRVKPSKPQAEIEEREQRLGNLDKNIFEISDRAQIKDRTVILIDDVCTTGATLNECARTLKEAGAKQVIGFVIARG
jgi:ComF family protein